jgi:hypothetical protein
LVGGKHLKLTNGDGLVYLPPIAGLLTRSIAYSATYRGKGIGISDQLICLLKPTFGDEFDITGHIGTDGAGIYTSSFARSLLTFIYHRFVGHSLRKEGVDSFPQADASLELADCYQGTFLLANTAANAFLLIHIACLAPNLNIEVTHVP